MSNVGLVFALSEFVVAWAIAYFYARRANVNERGCLCCHGGGPSFEWQIGASKRAMDFNALYKQKDHGTR